jgi:TonB family protein
MKPLGWIAAFVAGVSSAFCQSASSSAEQKVKALAIVAPPPHYPVDSQGRHPIGRGVVLMHIDTRTGWVISAKMQQSTGNKLLDAAAIAAFSHWRFRPGTVAYVHSAITFTHSPQIK